PWKATRKIFCFAFRARAVAPVARRTWQSAAGAKRKQAGRLLIGRDQPQPDRQRFAEHLALFLSFQLADFLDHAHPVAGDVLAAERGQYALAMAAVDVEGALAALACELGQAERPG